jgi:hypothetical protein
MADIPPVDFDGTPAFQFTHRLQFFAHWGGQALHRV